MTQYIFPITDHVATDASRVGPKAANLARMANAGLPTPPGFCIDAAGYRAQIHALGLDEDARGVMSATESPQARRHALNMKLGLLDKPITPEILEPLLEARRQLIAETGALLCVRSSALVEDRFGSSFAGQFESFIGIESEADFITAVRSCWGALWMTRALRYMATNNIDPADTAMGVLIQPLVSARASGGALSQTADGGMTLSATWGLGSAIAQGEVTPDRYELRRDASVLSPCLSEAEAQELGKILLRVEKFMDMPVEIEWAIDDKGFKLLQARPLHTQEATVPDAVWEGKPRINGHAAGIGWGTGRACVINCECELSRVAPGDILITKVVGPALSDILTKVAGVVAERGGSTSHMASLARERGIPMVLGVLDATQRIPDGSTVAVDGVAGVVRWMN